MVNRFVLNETSYHGAGAIKEIATEVKGRGFKKAFVCSDPDLIKFGVTKKVTDVLDNAEIDLSSLSLFAVVLLFSTYLILLLLYPSESSDISCPPLMSLLSVLTLFTSFHYYWHFAIYWVNYIWIHCRWANHFRGEAQSWTAMYLFYFSKLFLIIILVKYTLKQYNIDIIKQIRYTNCRTSRRCRNLRG